MKTVVIFCNEFIAHSEPIRDILETKNLDVEIYCAQSLIETMRNVPKQGPYIIVSESRVPHGLQNENIHTVEKMLQESRAINPELQSILYTLTTFDTNSQVFDLYINAQKARSHLQVASTIIKWCVT